MSNLEHMIKNVILRLEKRITQDGDSEKLNMLLTKYQSALSELLDKGKIKTNLIGGCRAYLDSFSDYANNDLLDCMYAVEKILKQQLKEEQYPSK